MKKWNENIKTDQKWMKSIFAFFEKPIPMYFIGIVTTIVLSFIFESEKAPFYYIKSFGTKDSTVIKLKIGNLGKEPLKFSDIISSPSIIVENNLKFEIDTIFISDVSRIALRDATSYQKGQYGNVLINLKNEAFEIDDFIIFNIKHEGFSHSNNWNVKTRILGVKNGLKNYTIIFGKTDVFKTIFFVWGTVCFLILIRIIFFKIYNKPVFFRIWEIIFLIILIVIGSFYVYIYLSITQYIKL